MGSKLKKEEEHDETSRVFSLIIFTNNIIKFDCLLVYYGKPFESDDPENMWLFSRTCFVSRE